jgi:hypothetical protein
MRDPVLVLGLIWAAYLAVRLGVEAALRHVSIRARLLGRTRRSSSHEPSLHSAKWSPLPAAVWLVRETLAAAAIVGVVWLLLRDVGLPNLVPGAVSAAPGDLRRVAIAAILAWSLAVINMPAAWQFIGKLLPAEDEKPDKRVDPGKMGATIGVLERALVIALIPGGGPAAVGFVVAAKTLARFRELNNKRFAERYLLGTMASVTIALVGALAVQWIWAAPF